MPPSIGLHDKRSAGSHDVPRHQSGPNRSTSVPAQRTKSSINEESVARLHTDQVLASAGFMQATKSVEDDLDQMSLDQGHQKTVCKVPNNQLGPGRLKSLNRDMDQQTSSSVRVADSIPEMDHTVLATSRTKSMHTNLYQPGKDTARKEKTGSKLPMYQARLTVIPPHQDETTIGVKCNQKPNAVTEGKYLGEGSSVGLDNLTRNNLKKPTPLLPSGLSNLANANRNKIATKETNKATGCNGTACSHAPIGCGVDCRKVKSCDSTKELRCAYSKKNGFKSKPYSIADALKSTINTGRIIDRPSCNLKSCEDDTSTSQFQTRPSHKTSVVHTRVPNAVKSYPKSNLSMLPLGFFDSSYQCAIHSLEDDYLPDIVSANDVSFRRPGEHSSVSPRSDRDAFLDQRMDVLKIGELNKEMNIESTSDVIIENILANVRCRSLSQITKDKPFHTIGADHLSSKEYTTNQSYSQVSTISQEQASAPPPDSNRRETVEGKDNPNQQSGFRNYPPDAPRWVFEEAEKFVDPQFVQLPEKQVSISVTPTQISKCFQQSKMEDHWSNQEPLYDQPNPEVQHCYALPRFSQPMEENLLCKAPNDYEFMHQSSEESTGKQRQNKPLLTVCDESCQTNLIATVRSTKEPEPDRGKMRTEAKKTQQQIKSRHPAKIVGVEVKAPSSKHAAVTPVSRKLIKKISPSRLSRFERTLSTSKKLRASKNRSCYKHNFFSPKMCLRNVCPCPSCSENVSLLESAILYHTGNSPRAKSEETVVASCLNQYIELIFSGLDSYNTGFITEKQFVALMKTLGCETHIPTDKTLKISSVDFPKRLWQCWSQNHSQTTYLDKPKTRKPLLESILSSKSDIESMENLSGQLEDINTSMKSVTSSDSVEYSNLGQGLGHRLWQNKQRDLARSKENRYLKGILRDLRSALLRLGVENVILKVKILLESPGSSFNSQTTERILDVQHIGKVRGSEGLSNGENTHQTSSNKYSIDECSKCRKHKCPDVQLSSRETKQERNSLYDPKMSNSEDGMGNKFHNESPEWKSKIQSSDANLSEMYLTMNGYRNSQTHRSAHSPSNILIRDLEKRLTPETNVMPKPNEPLQQLSENVYVNQPREFYEENPIYCSINNDDQYEYMALKTNMDLGPEIRNFQSSLYDSDKEEEVSWFESDVEPCPRLIRSNASRSKGKVSFSTRSSRSSRIRRTTLTSRHLGDYAPPLLPRRRYITQPKMSPNQEPSVSPYHLSPTSFGTALTEMGTSMPYAASTPIRSENQECSQLKNPIDTFQKPEVRFDRSQDNHTKSNPISQSSVSSSRSTSETSSQKFTHSDATNEQVEVVLTRKFGNSKSSGSRPSYLPQPHHEQHGTLSAEHDRPRKSEQPRECVMEESECSAVVVLNSDLPRGAALKSSRTSLKSLLSMNNPRKSSTGRDSKTPKKNIAGKNRARALPELLATRALLLEALSVVKGKAGSSSSVEEASVATDLGRKPRCDTVVHAAETPSLEDGSSTKRSSASEAGKSALETTEAGLIQGDSISLGEDESKETNQGLLEETKIGVESIRSSVLEKEEEFKSLVSTIESSLVLASGRRRTRGSSRRRERNVPLPVITENVEVKPNVRLSLKLYENLRRDNLNISEDSSDESASENNDLTVDDILAEVMTYCRENGVPIKENGINQCEFEDKSEQRYENPSHFESIQTSESDVEHGANSKPCIIYNESSPVGAPHTTLIQNWKQQCNHKLYQPSPQMALTSNTTDIANVTDAECTNSSGCRDHNVEDNSCSGGGFETELDGRLQVEEEVEEQEDDGSVLLEDGCSSSCSSGSDSGRGESETSCPTPEEHLSCNSGGSDDGIWTSEDYSCLNHMTSGSDCHPQPVRYQTELSSCDQTQTTSPHTEQNQNQNPIGNSNSITRSLDATEHFSTRYQCGQVDGKCFGNFKSYSHDAETLLEESRCHNHQEDSQGPTLPKLNDLVDCAISSVPERSKILATLFEDYDNVDNGLDTVTPMVEQKPELEIIDLDEEQSTEQQSIRKDERTKSKTFFGRRCSSFSTLRSFISSTTSHLKRNGPCRSSFSSSKSLPNYFSVTKTVPDLTPYSGTQLKSIFKNTATRPGSNLQRNSSKRISFSDTIDVYPEGSTFPVKADGKRCYRYPAGLEIPEYSPRTRSQVSSEADGKESRFELQRDDGIRDQVETKSEEHRNEIFPVMQYNEISSNESVILPSQNSLDLNDILLSLTEFSNEVKKTNFIASDPLIKNVNFLGISNPVSETTENQEIKSINQAPSYSIERLPDATKESSSSNTSGFSSFSNNHRNDHTDANPGVGLTITTSAASRMSEAPSEGSGQALLAALELELEDVLRSLEDEEAELA